MKKRLALILTPLLGTALAASEIYPSISTRTNPGLVPGKALPATFQNAAGESVALPATGRSLLWAEHTRVIVQTLPREQSVVGSDLNATTRLGRTSVLFYNSWHTPLPGRAQRSGVPARYPGAQVLFDDRDRLGLTADYRSKEPGGLYLLDGTRVACRFYSGFSGAWDAQGYRPIIFRSAETFMRTGRVMNCPEPLLSVGAKINTRGLPGAGKVRLLYRVRGDEFLAPPGSIRINFTRQADGGHTEFPEGSHPGSVSRYVLDTLARYARGAGAVPVALIARPEGNAARMKQTWPDWTFLPRSPENLLRWVELVGAVIGPDDRVRLSFTLSGSTMQEGVEMLQQALKP